MDLNSGSAAEAIDRAISESHEENLSAAAPVKKKASMRAGGRPRKGGLPNKATIRRMQEMLGSAGDPNNGATAVPPSGDPLPDSTAASQEVAVEIPLPLISHALKFPYDLAASKTGFEGWRLDDGTADALAPQVDKIIQTYFPKVDSKHLPLVMVLGTLVATTGMKVAAYNRWLEEQRKPPEDRGAA